MDLRSLRFPFLFALVCVSILLFQKIYSSSKPPVGSPIGEFTLADSAEQPFRAPEDFLGHVTIVNFFFTKCGGPCPALMSKLAALNERLTKFNNVRLVSITIDPDFDLPERLATYAAERGIEIGSRWKLLRGKLDTTIDLSEKTLGQGLDAPNQIHTTRVALVDTLGNLRGVYSTETESDLRLLQNTIESLAD